MNFKRKTTNGTNILILCLFLSSHLTTSSAVCYGDLGCFSQSSPWVSMYRPFPPPVKPEDNGVNLVFFSREETNGDPVNIYPDITTDVPNFSPGKRVVTITHGFDSSASEDWVLKMKTKYLENVDANIFLVNWEQGASGINYFQAAANTRVVGAMLGRFGKYLIDNKGVSYSNFHMIGHSLGAHVTGYAAKFMNNGSTDGQKVNWITGLDVAQPGFQDSAPEVTLNIDDAKFVEAIHTDAKSFLPYLGFGYTTPLGHLDFFINRGYDQPDCNDVDFEQFKHASSLLQLLDYGEEVVSHAISCSHGRSHEVYTASFDPDVKCDFIGHRITQMEDPITSNQFSCGTNGEDCIKMGLDTPNQKPRGAFQVMTSGKEPYCCYNYSKSKGCKATPQ